MVIFTIELNELGCKVLADTTASRSDSLYRSLRQHISAVLCYKYQMNMKEAYYGPSSSVVCAFPVACHSKTKYSGVMQRLQAFKYELIADGAQNRSMRQFAGACRFVYNKALALQHANHQEGLKFIGYVAMAKKLTDWRNGVETPWLKEAPVHPLQHALKDMERAYKNFFAKRTGFPRFKRKGVGDSFRYPDAKQIKLDLPNARIFLPKLGRIRLRLSRPVLGEVRNVTVSQNCGKWFVSIQTKREVKVLAPASTSSVGIDVGITRFATLSDGSFLAPLNSFKRHQERLARYQRRMARKVKGSCNWKKARAKVQRVHTDIANARKDFLHKASTQIANSNALVCIEDLEVRNMSASTKGSTEQPGRNVRQKSGLNRSILDQGWGEFRRQLEYKTQWSGAMLIAVPPHHTSQTCPQCGHVASDNRKTQALFLCVSCGHTNNADVVGAVNVLERGQRLLACGEDVSRVAFARKPRAGSMKQEPAEVTTSEVTHA
jgi:putative transposase